MQDRCEFEVVDERPERHWEGTVLHLAFMLQFFIPVGLLSLGLIISLPSGVGILLLMLLSVFILVPWMIYSCIYAFCSLQASLSLLLILNLSCYVFAFIPDFFLAKIFFFFALYNSLPSVGYLILLLSGKKIFFEEWRKAHPSWLVKS